MSLKVIQKLAPPDAQLLAALRPLVEAQSRSILDRTLAESRKGSLDIEQLWATVGALTALQDLENTLKSKLAEFARQEPIR